MRWLTILATLGLLTGCMGNMPDLTPLPPAGDGGAADDEAPAEDPVDVIDDVDPSDAPIPQEDPPPAEEPPTRPVDTEEEPSPEEEPPSVELVQAGGPCDCDSECEPTGGFVPLCIHGICGVQANDDACPAGSDFPCPAGHRCWSGTGRGICYPDYVPGSCAGAPDGDSSCVTDGSRDCYRACGDLCDLPGEPPGSAPPDDLPDDPPDDPLGPCTYPAGPYGWRQGSVAGPMSWPSAVAGSDESGRADLGAWHCDPEINSIMVQIVGTYCSVCPERMRMIAGLRDHWEATGVRWIFVVNDVASAAQASAYVDRYGVSFGFRTNDADNSLGPGTIVNAPIYSAIPWTAVVRASDMVFLYSESSSGYLDLESIASELAR